MGNKNVINQTNRTILFEEINPEKMDILTLINDSKGLDSLDDENIIEINQHLLVGSFDEFLEATSDKNYYLITKFGAKNYCDFDFSNADNEDIYFIFGRETKGLPKEFREKYSEQALRIPMSENVRSLNLSNTAALVIYEALRQQNFNKLQ